MLPSAHRMRRSVDFTAVLRGGRRFSSRTVVLHVASPVGDEPTGPSRVGLIVSKAVGGSVVRSRVKRRLRAAVAPHLPLLRGDIVLRALPGAATAPYGQLAADLDRAIDACLRRSGVPASGPEASA